MQFYFIFGIYISTLNFQLFEKQTNKKKLKKKESDSLSIFGSQRVKLLSADPLTVNPLTFLRC